jgi:NADPH-dependent curcumin reductase CurA
MQKTIRQWVLAKQLAPDDALTRDHFALRELELPELEHGQALARVRLLNLHANSRRRIATGSIRVGATDPSNYACVEIIASRDAAFPTGATAACQAGWQDYQVISSSSQSVGYGPASELVAALNGTKSQWTYTFRDAIARMWPPSTLMNMLGTSGMTAYFGLRECGPLMPGDTIAVANAGGAVGIIIAQIAKRAGCRVVGIAGGAERCAKIVESIGIDACIDYRADHFDRRLQAAFSNGIDVYTDGVAGDLTAQIARLMNRHGRLLAYGSTTDAYAPRVDTSLERSGLSTRKVFVSPTAEELIAAKHIKVESWIVHDFYHERLKAEDDLSRLMLGGSLKSFADVRHGLDELPDALTSLYGRSRLGKAQVSFE